MSNVITFSVGHSGDRGDYRPDQTPGGPALPLWTPKTTTRQEFTALLTANKPGGKAGASIASGIFRDGRRKKDHFERAGILLGDYDLGHPAEEIVRAVKSQGWTGLLVSTFSHLTTGGIVVQKKVVASGDLTDGPGILRSLGYHESVWMGARVSDMTDNAVVVTPGGPVRKYRLILPFDTPVSCSPTEWSALYAEVMDRIAIPWDRACADCTRLVYITRRRDGGPDIEVHKIPGRDVSAASMLAAAKANPSTVDRDKAPKPHDPTDPVSDYNYRATAVTAANLLRNAGWTDDSQDEANIYLTRPGKETGKSCSIRRDGFVVTNIFTSSDTTLAAESYSTARLYAALEHGGDMKAAAEALCDQGYGLRKYSEQELLAMVGVVDCNNPQARSRFFLDMVGSDISPLGKEALVKAIAEDWGVSKTGVKAELAQAKRSLAERAGGGGDHVTQHAIAQAVLDHFGDGNLLHALGGFRQWNGVGVWKLIPDQVIKQIAMNLTDEAKITASLTNGVLDILASRAFTDKIRPDHTSKTICCLNGQIRVDNGAASLIEPVREDYNVTQVQANYLGTGVSFADCPTFKGYLDLVQPDDPDTHRLILELVGLAALPRIHFHKFFILLGDGANGKSVLTGLIENILGYDHVTHIEPDRLNGRFAGAEIVGKLAIIASDLPEGCMVADGALKQLSAGDMVHGEAKFGKGFSFKPCATPIFAANFMPYSRDTSKAFLRRAVVIPFDIEVPESDQDEQFLDKLTVEKDVVFSMGVNALVEAIDRGKLTTTRRGVAAVADWAEEASQIMRFVRSQCVVEPKAFVTTDELHEEYLRWARANGVKGIYQLAGFASHLSKASKTFRPLQGVERTKRAADGKQTRGFTGIRLKTGEDYDF